MIFLITLLALFIILLAWVGLIAAFGEIGILLIVLSGFTLPIWGWFLIDGLFEIFGIDPVTGKRIKK